MQKGPHRVPFKSRSRRGTINRNARRIRLDGCDGHALDWFSFAVLWYNQVRPEQRREPPVNNGCRWRQLSRGLQRILFFACESDLEGNALPRTTPPRFENFPATAVRSDFNNRLHATRDLDREQLLGSAFDKTAAD